MNWARVERLLEAGAGRIAPAIVLHVRYRGDTVFEGAYGVMDPESAGEGQPAPVSPDALFDLASVTKLFTTTAFMRLVEAGHVRLDQPVAEVIPQFAGVRPIGGAEDPISRQPIPPDPAFAGQEVDTRCITFRHLLTHTSGLAAWHSIYRAVGPPPPPPGQPTGWPTVEERTSRGIQAICAYPFLYPPGQRLVYSDLGLILLGEAAARLAGQRLDAAIRSWVLEPLGLIGAGFRPLDMPSRADVGRCVPTEFCAWRGRRLRGEVHDENAGGLGGVAGHAGLFATAAHVARLGQMYLDGGRWENTPLLSPGSVREMTREQVRFGDDARGLGWMRRSAAGSSSGRYFSPDSFGHTGYTGTSLWVDPQRQLVVSLMTNRVYYGRDPKAITHFRPAVHDAIVEALGQ
ncbi:MAG: serine hydrolase [Anaerolineae bacterium]|nr:serine hydrolase [Anaerolineae bacterium]